MNKKEELIETIWGATVDEAKLLIEKSGLRMRIRYQDGVSSKSDTSSPRDRIDVAVKDGKVVQAYLAL